MGLFDSFNQFAGGLSPQAGLGLLASGTSLLSGAPVGQAINTGFGTYQSFLDMDKEKKRREALKKLINDPNLDPSVKQYLQIAPNQTIASLTANQIGGRSAGERSLNVLTRLSAKIRNGIPLTKTEEALYTYHKQKLSGEKTQTYIDDTTGKVTKVTLPGINFGSTIEPMPNANISEGKKVLSETTPTFGEGVTNRVGFGAIFSGSRR